MLESESIRLECLRLAKEHADNHVHVDSRAGTVTAIVRAAKKFEDFVTGRPAAAKEPTEQEG